MKWSRWKKLLDIISRIRIWVPYGILKNIACEIECKIEDHMVKIEPR